MNYQKNQADIEADAIEIIGLRRELAALRNWKATTTPGGCVHAVSRLNPSLVVSFKKEGHDCHAASIRFALRALVLLDAKIGFLDATAWNVRIRRDRKNARRRANRAFGKSLVPHFTHMKAVVSAV